MKRVDEWQILDSKNAKLHGQERILAAVNRTLAPGDGMYKGGDAYYLEAGASALCFIQHALAAGDRSIDHIERILDYACGFGRVLRWLCAGFPLARIVAVDTNPKAVNAVREIFDVETYMLDLSLREAIGRDFDLIWVGSLFTHLPQAQLSAVIDRLRTLLSPRGMIIATMHGPFVAKRIATGEKTYGLDAAGVASITDEYERTGYGFSPHPKLKSYGIAICTPSKLTALIEAAGLYSIVYQEHGWMNHQDCIAVAQKI